jgi:hypothetical protein
VENSPATAYYEGQYSYTVTGTPTITDGIVSNFSNSNYVSVTRGNLTSWEGIELVIASPTYFSTSLSTSTIFAKRDDFYVYCKSSGQLQANFKGKTYSLDTIGKQVKKLKFKFTDSKTYGYYSTDGERYTQSFVANELPRMNTYNNFVFGARSYSSAYDGAIDLNNSYIVANNKAWFGNVPADDTLTGLVLNGFNIDKAVGKQLDILGKYIGLKRQVKVNIGTSDTNILTDEQYRILLKLKLVQNTSFSSTSQIRAALYELFPNDIRLFDPRTMVYEYQLSTLFNDLENVIRAENLLPLPMGLGVTINVVPDLLSLYGYYGYDGLNDNPNGYSSYTDGFKGKYLSYGDRT